MKLPAAPVLPVAACGGLAAQPCSWLGSDQSSSVATVRGAAEHERMKDGFSRQPRSSASAPMVAPTSRTRKPPISPVIKATMKAMGVQFGKMRRPSRWGRAS